MAHHELETWRNELQNLDWSQGYSKEELMSRFPNIPQRYFQNVASGQKYYSFNEFWNQFAPVGIPGTEARTQGSGGPQSTGGYGTGGMGPGSGRIGSGGSGTSGR